MFIPDHFIEELKQRISISQIINKRVKLKRLGPLNKGLCPFHREKTPSFTVHDHKGIYYCFGCHASGDVINFVSKTENLSFLEAVEYLAGVARMELPKVTPSEQKKIERTFDLIEVLTKATEWFQNQLKLSTNHHAYEYLTNRGLNDQDLKNFSLGYAPAKGLLPFLQKENISLNKAIEVGLVIKTESNQHIERFRNRIIFPIKNQKNQVVGFGSRALTSDITPKYLNSPETILFKKNNLLYAADIARKIALKTERVIVVEGYMDAISMHKAGIQDTVAALGTAFNQTHINLLWNIANEPILCFDGDEAGKKAMLKAAHVALPILKPGLTLKFCSLPKGLDPDDVIKQHGTSLINKLIDNSISLSEFIWQSEFEQAKLKTPEGKALFEHKVHDLVKQINDPIVKNYYQRFMKEKLWISFNSFKKTSPKTPVLLKEPILPTLTNLSYTERLEYSLIAKLIQFPDLVDDLEIYDNLCNLEIYNENLEKVRSIILKYHENKENLLNDLLIENNLGKLSEFLCGKNSSFINNISTIDLSTAKEIWLITYKKHFLEIIKAEYNKLIQKSFDDISFAKTEELKKTIDNLIKEITKKEQSLI